MNYRLLIILILAGIGFAGRLPAQTTEFSYDGRVRSGGVPFDGNGLFKFAIVSSDGAICYWSNDGVTLTGDEPTSSVQIQVSSGFFSSIIGDETVSGMAPLDPSIFNTEERVNLRVWFNDGANGFQKLTPDRSIANPALIGIQSARPLTIYVNPVTGNDRNAGSKPSNAKRTIQAAWNALPSLVSTTATIQLAAGEYYQTAVLTGKLVQNEARIILNGDLVATNTVRIFGSTDRATSTTPSQESVLKVIHQSGVTLQGLQVEYAKRLAIHITDTSYVDINRCRLINNLVGVWVLNQSLVSMNNLYVADSLIGPVMDFGASISTNSTAYVNYCTFIHHQAGNSNGVLSTYSSSAVLTGTTIDGFYKGAIPRGMGLLALNGGNNVIRNCYYGALAEYNSILVSANPSSGTVTYQNCTISYSATSGSIID